MMPPSVIAKKVGCAKSNVSYVLNKYLNGIEPAELEDFRAEKANAFEALQLRTLASITDKDIRNASYLQRVTGAAIIQDKLQLMNGLPTSIHVTALLDIADLLRKREDK